MRNAIDLKPDKSSQYKHSKQKYLSPSFSQLSFSILVVCAIFFLLFQIHALTSPSVTVTSPSSSWKFLKNMNPYQNNSLQLNSLINRLRQSVTFLPLKDLRYSNQALDGHTWFMSSMYDKQENYEVQYQYFPSEESQGRVLCIQGNDTRDGSWNSYALAWEEALPYNATLLNGLTFVSYNHYDYGNIWHGLSAVFPFVAWHKKVGCANTKPDRWVLYHWGEVRKGFAVWLNHLMSATFGDITVETFDQMTGPVCFERAVVMRHNDGGMSREKREGVYDLLRCKARVYCNVSLQGKGADRIGMTMFMRTGARSFKNETAVNQIFERECKKVDGCGMNIAYSSNLSFCEQVRIMSSTDILVSPHGAQLTNMFLMDRGSSVMEFFPKGWLKTAGVGQFVYHWIASWSGMKHRGAWRDPDGDTCPYDDQDDRRCMAVYKNARIGHNETYFAEWARDVLNDVKRIKMDGGASKGNQLMPISCEC